MFDLIYSVSEDVAQLNTKARGARYYTLNNES
jgi:hypothetical protein